MIATQADLNSFHHFASSKLGEAGVVLTMEELLAKWLALSERAEVNAAIRTGLSDLSAGRMRPAKQVMEEMRRELNIPIE